MPKAIIQPIFKAKLDNAKLQKLRDRLARDGGYVTVGVHEDAGRYQNGMPVGLVATFMEFGAPAARVPERSFIRSTLKDNRKVIEGWAIEALGKMLTHGFKTETVLENIGFLVAEAIRNRIKSNVPPPLKEATIRAKQARGTAAKHAPANHEYPPTATLIDTGLLLRSIAYKVFAGVGKKPPAEGQ